MNKFWFLHIIEHYAAIKKGMKYWYTQSHKSEKYYADRKKKRQNKNLIYWILGKMVEYEDPEFTLSHVYN